MDGVFKADFQSARPVALDKKFPWPAKELWKSAR